MQLAVSTKNGFQAATAVFLTLALQRIFNLDHAYWSTLTAVLMITQTFGESIKKSVERVSMTTFGCVIGTLIYFAVKDSLITVIILMLIVTFFINYYFTVSYAIAAFFVSLLVVFNFATLGQWNTTILEARIFQTAIGAGIALLSTAIVFPMSTRKTLMDEFPEFVDRLQHIMNNCFTRIFDPDANPEHCNISKTFHTLQNKVHGLRNENLFHIYNKNEFNQLLFDLRTLGANITSAYDLAKDTQHCVCLKSLKPELLQFQNLLNHNFELLKARIRRIDCDKKFLDMEALRHKLRLKVAEILQKSITETSDWFKTTSLLYSLRRANESIKEILDTLEDDYSEEYADCGA